MPIWKILKNKLMIIKTWTDRNIYERMEQNIKFRNMLHYVLEFSNVWNRNCNKTRRRTYLTNNIRKLLIQFPGELMC